MKILARFVELYLSQSYKLFDKMLLLFAIVYLKRFFFPCSTRSVNLGAKFHSKN